MVWKSYFEHKMEEKNEEQALNMKTRVHYKYIQQNPTRNLLLSSLRTWDESYKCSHGETPREFCVSMAPF